MTRTLEQFAAECHRILKEEPGPAGGGLGGGLGGEDFVRATLTDDMPERKILYEDPDLGFCILGHVHHDAKGSNPHDHGPSWAIYGQARGETIMTDYFPVRS